MIACIYGIYTTSFHSYRPKDIKCYNCNAPNLIVVEKKVSVFHLMYIPIFPTRTRSVFTCKSCNNEFVLKDLKPEHKTYYQNFRSKKGTPIWLFSGSFIVLFTICWLVHNNSSNNEEMLNRLTNGNQKQIIEFETDNGNYSTLKTVKITSDSIWLNYNEFEIEKYDYIYRIGSSENYSTDTTKVHIQTIKDLFEEGNIEAIYPIK